MRKILIFSGIFFALFSYGLFLGHYDVRVVEDDLNLVNATEFYDYRGATNVHTLQNLGSGTYTEVIASAQEAGLDFLILSDLNTFKVDPSIEGYHRKLLVALGSSYSYLDSRIIAYDLTGKHDLETLGQAQMLLADLLSQRGSDAADELLVLAHPFKPGYEWSGPFPSGLDGIEVINLKSIWQKAWTKSKVSFLWSVIVYPFNSKLALLRLYSEPTEELRLWDQLNLSQKTIGFAGSDATAKTGSMGEFKLRFPSYEVLFGLLSNHVLLRSELTGDPSGDQKKVMEALNLGQFYMSLDLLGNPKGFTAAIVDGDKTHLIGSQVRFRKGQKLRVQLAKKPTTPFEIAILKDGEHVMSANSRETEYVIQDPGNYRVIVRVIPVLPLPDGKRWLTWIYTNPFFVK